MPSTVELLVTVLLVKDAASLPAPSWRALASLTADGSL